MPYMFRGQNIRFATLTKKLPLPPGIDSHSAVTYRNNWRVNALLVIKHNERWSNKKTEQAKVAMQEMAQEHGTVFSDSELETLANSLQYVRKANLELQLYGADRPGGRSVIMSGEDGEWWETPMTLNRLKVIEL